MSPSTNYGVIIIGTGPSDIFYTCELIQKKSDMKILMVEKGRSIGKRICPGRTARIRMSCRPCSTTTGFVYAGVFSGGKLSLSPDVGNNLLEILRYDKTVELLRKSDNIYLEFGADTNVYGVDKQEEIEETRCKAIGVNPKLIECPIRHLRTEGGYKIYTRFQKHLLTQNITMKFNTMVRDVIIGGSIVKGIIMDKDETYYTPEVVSVTGREGSDWFSYICGNHGTQTQVGTVDIGVHMEIRDEVMRFLDESLYEARLVYYTPTFDDKACTFCTNPSGEAATEYYKSGLAVIGGRAYKSQKYKINNTNFALLVSKNFTEPFNEPIEYGRYIAQLSNMLCGGRIMVQTFGDFQRGRRATEERLYRSNLIPTLKDAVSGDLSLIFPHRIMTDIKEMLLALDKVTPGTASDETFLYGVEVKFYSNKVVVNADFETSVRGLRAIRDGVSVTRGLQQTSASGINVTRSILRQMGVWT